MCMCMYRRTVANVDYQTERNVSSGSTPRSAQDLLTHAALRSHSPVHCDAMPPPSAATPVDEDEARRLADAKDVVKKQAFLMKRALDQRNLRDALKHACAAAHAD